MTAPLRIVALDLSLRATGIAVTHDSHGKARLACRTVSPRKFPSATAIDHRRLQETFRSIETAVACKPDLVVVEWLPQFEGKGDASLRLAELHGALKHWMWAHKLRYVDVLPQHLKIYATGNGNANKQQVREAVTGRYGKFLHIGTEDEADAVALLMSALAWYTGTLPGGVPLPSVPAVNAAALKKTAWPKLGAVA